MRKRIQLYILVLCFWVIISVIFVPMGFQSQRELQSEFEFFSLNNLNVDNQGFESQSINQDDLILLIKSNDSIINNRSYEWISSLLFEITSNPETKKYLRFPFTIQTIYDIGRELLRDYYQQVQGITILSNISIFISYNGTQYYLERFYQAFGVSNNISSAHTEAISQTRLQLENGLATLSTGIFFTNQADAFLDTFTQWWLALITSNNSITTNISVGLASTQRYLVQQGSEIIANLFNLDQTLFVDLFSNLSLVNTSYWNEATVFTVVNNWTFGENTTFSDTVVKKAFNGGNLLTPSILADREFLSFLNLTDSLPGIPTSSIKRLLGIFTNFDPQSNISPDTLVIPIPFNNNESIDDFFDSIKGLINSFQPQEYGFSIHYYATALLLHEVENSFYFELQRIDIWVASFTFFVILILTRKFVLSLGGTFLILLTTFATRGVLFWLTYFDVELGGGGFTLGSSILLGASINYIIFIIAKFKRQSSDDVLSNIIKTMKSAGRSVLISSSVLFAASGPLILSQSNLTIKTSGIVLAGGIPCVLFFSIIPLPLLFFLSSYKNTKKNLTLEKKVSKINLLFNQLLSLGVAKPKTILSLSMLFTLLLVSLTVFVGFSTDITDSIGGEGEIQQSVAIIRNEFPNEFLGKIRIEITLHQSVYAAQDTINQSQWQLLNELHSQLEDQLSLGSLISPVNPTGSPTNETISGFLPKAIIEILREDLITNNGKTNTFIATYNVDPLSEKGFRNSESLLVITSSFQQDHEHQITSIRIFGLAKEVANYNKALENDLIIIIPLSIIFAFVTLMIWFRSIILPIRFEYTVIISLALTIIISQMIVLIFTGKSINILVILLVLGFVNAIGLDFDIYLYTRFEELTETNPVSRISQAIMESSEAILVSGAVMALTYANLIFSSIILVQQIGLALTVAVLIDIVMTRSIISPLFMILTKNSEKL